MTSSSSLLPMLLALSLAAPLACTGERQSVAEPETKAAPKHLPGASLSPPTRVPSMPGGALPKKGSYAQAKVTCCTNARVNRVLDRALELHLALVSEEGVSEAMDAMVTAARDAEKEGALEPASLSAVVAIAVSAEGASGGELRDQRQAMLQIGRQLEQLIPAHAGGARDFAKAEDPSTGDFWYQREGKPSNPYGGTKAQFTR